MEIFEILKVFISFICKLLPYLGYIGSFGLFVIGICSYKTWIQKIQKENLEKIKIELAYAIINFVSYIEMHSLEDPSLSKHSELDKNAYKEIIENEERKKQEIYYIDIELTQMRRRLNKYVQLFDFYYTENENDFINELTNYEALLNSFCTDLYGFVKSKFAKYANSKEIPLDSFQEQLRQIHVKLKNIKDKHQVIMQKIKEL